MPDEVIINEAPPAAPVAPIVVPIEPEEEEEEELDYVAQLVAEDSIVREEQHEQLMEVMAECQTMLTDLAQLRSQMGAENPMLTQILSQMTELQAQMDQIRQELSTKPHGSRGTEESVMDYPAREQPSKEDTGDTRSGNPSPTEPPGQSEAIPPPKRKRFNKL